MSINQVTKNNQYLTPVKEPRSKEIQEFILKINMTISNGSLDDANLVRQRFVTLTCKDELPERVVNFFQENSNNNIVLFFQGLKQISPLLPQISPTNTSCSKRMLFE